MVRRSNAYLVIVTALLVAFAFTACAKSAGPKDDEALKMLQATVEGSLKGQTMKSPVVIVEKGQKLPSGDWPFTVSYTVANPDGTEKKVTAKYTLSPTIDSMGANTWNATEAK